MNCATQPVTVRFHECDTCRSPQYFQAVAIALRNGVNPETWGGLLHDMTNALLAPTRILARPLDFHERNAAYRVYELELQASERNYAQGHSFEEWLAHYYGVQH